MAQGMAETIRCPSCGHENPPEGRFCGECGAKLTRACPDCGTQNPPGQRFCGGCGRQLSAAAPQAEAPPEPRSQISEHLAAKIRAGAGALEGERKQVTVLFADVVGSMELAAQAGPEAWRGIVERLFSLCCDAVLRYEGTVDKFTGDGIMVLFGAPIAHEDHARRACYAALHLQRELATYAAELRRTEGLSFSVRMGLNSGEVIVGAIGEDLEMDYTAIGHTVGLAQRMEQLAEPGKVYLAEDTAELVEGFLALRDLGEFEVKGVSEGLRVHELTGVGAARGRLDVSRERGFSLFVGRAEEMRILVDALEQSADEQGQVIGLIGEAGVGKSRLCHEFAQRSRAQGLPVYHVAAQAHTKAVPLMPVLQLMRTYFEITEQDPDQTARERIAGKLLLLDESFAPDLPLIFDFLSVPDPERPAPRMDPDARQRQLLGLNKRLVRAQNTREPGVTIFEDLHWIDPGSEAFLENFVDAIHATKSLTIANFRPQYRAEWMSKSYYRQISLAPLGPEAIEELLADLLGSDPSLGGLPERIRERAGGNPFFIEEVVQSLAQEGSLEGERGTYRLVRPVEDAAVPASVQAVLSARIDRLGEREKTVLQTAAVIGKEFSEPILAQVSELERSELQDALSELVAGEFVHEQELYPEAVYAFKHPLTQEVAYGSQLADRRAAVHAAIARALLEQHPERVNERAALLAQHWEAAGEPLEAARWNAVAAAWAGTSDPRVSLRHWRKVRELADSLPESEETTSLGLAARINALQYGWRLGISHDDAAAIFSEAERMASRAGDIRSRAMLLSVYGGSRGINDGDVRDYAELVRRSIALAEESGDPELYMTTALSSYAFSLAGDFREAIAALDRAIELADGDTTLGAGIAVGCPYAHCLTFKGSYLIYLGELEEARRLIKAGMKLAGEQEDVEEVGWGHMFFCLLAVAVGAPEEMLGHAQQSLEIAERIGDALSRSFAWYWLGAAERSRDNWRPAVEALERSGAISREQHAATIAEPLRLALLAEAHLGLGENERALEKAAEGVAIARAQGHVTGELIASLAQARVLLGAHRPDARAEIEAALTRALELVHDTGANAYEPQVHVELAELARQSGDEGTWREELSEAHRLFTEIGASGHAERVAEELAVATS
jgi:class 3 adenylate cyclase/tetratricopeptide (TPR) repeat protein